MYADCVPLGTTERDALAGQHRKGAGQRHRTTPSDTTPNGRNLTGGQEVGSSDLPSPTTKGRSEPVRGSTGSSAFPAVCEMQADPYRPGGGGAPSGAPARHPRHQAGAGGPAAGAGRRLGGHPGARPTARGSAGWGPPRPAWSKRVLSMALGEERGRHAGKPGRPAAPARPERWRTKLGWTLDEASSFLQAVADHRPPVPSVPLVPGYQGCAEGRSWRCAGTTSTSIDTPPVVQQLALERGRPVPQGAQARAQRAPSGHALGAAGASRRHDTSAKHA